MTSAETSLDILDVSLHYIKVEAHIFTIQPDHKFTVLDGCQHIVTLLTVRYD